MSVNQPYAGCFTCVTTSTNHPAPSTTSMLRYHDDNATGFAEDWQIALPVPHTRIQAGA
ncbi:hypothetical protein [Williamsia sp. DF01-3]|uniref:hypothetical protein n=1 Tax=Williamsia sp. DF01-3 TaxID=2934157 RepID=UPI001FF2925C|nr:hypothetical protein [Williamsia sp. DF01-3]MCK0516565.1 hypothetical protein [Williamsia sp. DF01-3]